MAKRKKKQVKVDDLISEVAHDAVSPPPEAEVQFAAIIINAITMIPRGRTPKKKKSPPQWSYVKCPSCGQVHHALTDDFDPGKPPHSGMIKLLPIYEELGWERPPTDITLGYGVLRCCGCEAPLAPSGRLKLVSLNHRELKSVLSNQI